MKKVILVLYLLYFFNSLQAEYKLIKSSSTGGNPNVMNPPQSTSYKLTASSVGGINPGFLTPMFLITQTDSLWFGDVDVNTTVNETFNLVNQAFQDVTIENLYNNNEDFSCTENRTTLLTNETLEINIDFTPSTHGVIKDTLFIETDLNDHQIILCGNGLGAFLFVSLDEFEFGMREALHEEEIYTFYLKNDGNVDNMYTTSIELSDGLNFSILNDPANPIWIADVGDSSTLITLEFHPQEIAEFNTEIAIPTNAYNAEEDGKVHLSIHAYGTITPANPTNISISKLSSHMSLNWNPVTQSIYGEDLSAYPVLYYLIYRNDIAYYEPADNLILSASANPSFLDYNVSLYKNNAFYKIVAVNELPFEQSLLLISNKAKHGNDMKSNKKEDEAENGKKKD